MVDTKLIDFIRLMKKLAKISDGPNQLSFLRETHECLGTSIDKISVVVAKSNFFQSVFNIFNF